LAGLVVLGSTGCTYMPMHYHEMSDTEAKTFDYGWTKVDLIPVPLAVAQARNDTLGQMASVPSVLLADTLSPYRLGPNDVVTVVVWEHPELTTPLGQFRSDNAAGQVIAPDGTLYFPYVGVFKAAGHTAAELRDKISSGLQKVLNEPQVDVKVTDFRSQRVFLTGELLRPGIVPITDNPLTLADALHQAGGFSAAADAGRVELVRAGKTFELDIAELYARGIALDKVIMRNGDMVRVPASSERKVYLMGEVGQNSAIPMVNGRLSLVQALAEAGGVDRVNAAAEAIYVIRFADSAHIKVFHLDAHNPLMLAVGDQFALKPKDVVFVAASGLARWNRFVSLVLPTASLVNSVTGSAINVQTLQE